MAALCLGKLCQGQNRRQGTPRPGGEFRRASAGARRRRLHGHRDAGGQRGQQPQKRELAIAGQQPPVAGLGDLGALAGRRRQRRVAELDVAHQPRVDRPQRVEAHTAPLHVQRVDEDAAAGPGRDRDGVVEGAHRPVGHELDDRADRIRPAPPRRACRTRRTAGTGPGPRRSRDEPRAELGRRLEHRRELRRPGPGRGRSLIASTSSTAIPVSARRRAVWASMAEPGVIGHGRSSSVAGETRRPTAPNPAAALTVTSSGGATPSSVR